MTSPLLFDGTQYTSPDISTSQGVAVSDIATRLTNMKNTGQYYQELGSESEILLYSGGDSFGLLAYRSFILQKLFSMFVARESQINGQKRLRFVSRNLAMSLTLESALRACGENVNGLSDNYETATDIVAVNTILAPIYLQIYKST